jgi:hypothetical protein
MTINPFLTAVYDAGGSPQSKQHITRKLKADTAADARAKANALVQQNREWFQFGLTKPRSLLYSLTGKTYTLHIKYANRKLRGWCEDGFDEYEDIEHEHMLQMFDSLTWSIDNGECDTAFQVIIDDIARMRKSKNA